MNPKSSMFERILVYCFLMIPLLSISARAQTVDTIQIITGTVRDAQTSEGIPGVNVISGDRGTATDIDGKFQLEIAAGDSLTITRIGYKTIRIYPRKETLEISLEPTIIHGEDVEVVATRAVRGVSPVAFSTLSREEIETRYTVEDVPMVLALEPGVHAYSESGNGTGYSYISIRGFDQSRISVMLDNVPLNDNESHQVYWVDHGDILSSAKDVQIQRGIGNSLYGASAFGGSINIETAIAADQTKLSVTAGTGSYDTQKYRIHANSGQSLGKHWSADIRGSWLESDGYRNGHSSRQKAVYAGVEHRSSSMINRFRTLIGYERTNLLWDGVDATMINDRDLRRDKLSWSGLYTDDFLQQVYSLNTIYTISPSITLRNVTYLVNGSGYYEIQKYGENFFDYNLDIHDQYPDSVEVDSLATDLTRQKWIENQYYGIIPTVTFNRSDFRLDVGGELRSYRGNHFGEVTDFSDSALAAEFGNDWYRYYQYIGEKQSWSGFIHVVYSGFPSLRVISDVQIQHHGWTLDQKTIGHAPGYQLSADWTFINPRVGIVKPINDQLSLFAHYGTAQKEPADDQIIEADDMSDTTLVKNAAAEKIKQIDVGLDYWFDAKVKVSMNRYYIKFDNEQLKKIDSEQEGEYEYSTADKTVHEGVEFEIKYQPSTSLAIAYNETFSDHHFVSGDHDGNLLPNVPNRLMNLEIRYQPVEMITLSGIVRHVGKQYLAKDNELSIDPYTVIDAGMNVRWNRITFNVKVNNVMDELYSTYGYDWGGYGYYWPGATRNYFASLSVRL